MADALVQKYAPLPAASLSQLIAMLFHAAHQWADLRKPTLARAQARLAHAKLDGVDWFWPADEDPTRGWRIPAKVRLLAPFDPVVWDRRRFELLWGWAYRFEAYTPAAKRVRPLRLAAAVARSGHRLGQPQGRGRRAESGAGLRGEAPARPGVRSRPGRRARRHRALSWFGGLTSVKAGGPRPGAGSGFSPSRHPRHGHARTHLRHPRAALATQSRPSAAATPPRA